MTQGATSGTRAAGGRTSDATAAFDLARLVRRWESLDGVPAAMQSAMRAAVDTLVTRLRRHHACGAMRWVTAADAQPFLQLHEPAGQQFGMELAGWAATYGPPLALREYLDRVREQFDTAAALRSYPIAWRRSRALLLAEAGDGVVREWGRAGLLSSWISRERDVLPLLMHDLPEARDLGGFLVGCCADEEAR